MFLRTVNASREVIETCNSQVPKSKTLAGLVSFGMTFTQTRKVLFWPFSLCSCSALAWKIWQYFSTVIFLYYVSKYNDSD